LQSPLRPTVELRTCCQKALGATLLLASAMRCIQSSSASSSIIAILRSDAQFFHIAMIPTESTEQRSILCDGRGNILGHRSSGESQ